MKELPLYNCHKQVRAAKIKDIVVNQENGFGTLYFEDPTLTPQTVTAFYMGKHDPKAGGYYVQYAEGYQSWSPAKAFEEGYTLAES